MADSTETPSGVSYYPQSSSVDSITLLSASGQKMELKKMMLELSYYEDIYSFSVSGHVSIKDAQGLIEGFQLASGGFIELDFGRVKDSTANLNRKFRIYKIGDRKPEGTLNTEVYTLYFCSEELLLSEQINIKKSYSGQQISKTVEMVLKNELGVKKNMNIEPTSGVYDFVGQRKKCFAFISWLSIYARPATQDTAGADMIFFENKNGYNFRSLRSLFQQRPYQTYKYQQNNTDSSMEAKTTSVLQFEYVKTFDTLNEISSGTFANRVITVDPLTRSYKVTDFDYNKYIQKSAPENGNGVLNAFPNRFGKSPNQTPESVVKVYVSNSEQYKVPYIKDRPGSVGNDIYAENFVPNRTAQIALANYTVLKIVVPGDPQLTAGMTINFETYSLGINGDKREIDKYYSGKYLINAVRHILQSQGVYQTVLEIAKESYDKPLQNATQNKDMREAKSE